MKQSYNNAIKLACFSIFLILSFHLEAFGAEKQTDSRLEPAVLDYMGIRDVLALDKDLRERSPHIAAICRSMTYFGRQPLNDYLPDRNHDCLSGSDSMAIRSLAVDVSEHATAIAAILIGSDMGFGKVNFQYEGAVPNANLDVYEFWQFMSSNVFGQQYFEADVLTISSGLPFEDWWTRGLENLAQNTGVVITAGIGNGSEAYDSLLYPAAGANILGVGVVDSVLDSDQNLIGYSLPRLEHSSAGPSVKGTCKPDIVALGNCLVPIAKSKNKYRLSGDWSSYATPIAAAAAALTIEKARLMGYEEYIDSADGNCVVKAVLMNSAVKLPGWHKGDISTSDDHSAVLDYLQGAGMVNAMRAYETISAGLWRGKTKKIGWDKNIIKADMQDEKIYSFSVPNSKGKVVCATLNWNRKYNFRYPFESKPELDGNLRLELWGVPDVRDSSSDVLLDYSDSLQDNVEHIYFACTGEYERFVLVVSNSDQSERLSEEQVYGIAWQVRKKDPFNKEIFYDLDRDGNVGIKDFNILLSNIDIDWTDTRVYPPGDINTDGKVDFADSDILWDYIQAD